LNHLSGAKAVEHTDLGSTLTWPSWHATALSAEAIVWGTTLHTTIRNQFA